MAKNRLSHTAASIITTTTTTTTTTNSMHDVYNYIPETNHVHHCT
jgi:hypothetical protein